MLKPACAPGPRGSRGPRRLQLAGVGLVLPALLRAADLARDAEKAADQTWRAVSLYDPRSMTAEDIGAWLILGTLVGFAAGWLTTGRTRGLGWLPNLLIGLLGAFLGGVLATATGLDLGWGQITLRYEELLAALACAVALIVGWRLWRRSRAARKAAASSA